MTVINSAELVEPTDVRGLLWLPAFAGMSGV